APPESVGRASRADGAPPADLLVVASRLALDLVGGRGLVEWAGRALEEGCGLTAVAVMAALTPAEAGDAPGLLADALAEAGVEAPTEATALTLLVDDLLDVLAARVRDPGPDDLALLEQVWSRDPARWRACFALTGLVCDWHLLPADAPAGERDALRAALAGEATAIRTG
ncbi:MAG: hypothetical protein MUE51_16235, partial [Thermoleophilia bacterium]|nr:hypothetical protein [Thermoleophilia bacterium]